MKQKILFILLPIVVLISVVLVLLVYAYDEGQLPGITPDSMLYGLDVFVDEARVSMASSPLETSKIRLDIMEERITEMEEMAVNNKPEQAKIAETEMENQMQGFESSIENVQKKDAPELMEHVQAHTERLEMLKQRLSDSGLTDYADAMIEAIAMLETTQDVIVNIPEDLSPESVFIITSLCKEAGATTIEECNELISSGALTATVGIIPEGSPPDPHGCSGFWADYVTKTKWCCDDSDGYYSPEHIEHLMRIDPDTRQMVNYFYRKGTVEYKIINLETEEIEEGTEVDSCDGNTLTEWLCPTVLDMVTRNERYSETYECSYKCEDGACIACNLDSVCDEIESCSCPDCEGKNNGCRHSDYVCQDGECVPGEVSEEGFDGECTDSDGGQDYFVKGTTFGKSPATNSPQTYIDACIDDSQLGEGFCVDYNNEVNIASYLCPNGCHDGACIA